VRHIIIALALLVGVAGLAPTTRADDATAVRTLAEQGDAEAQFALGTMYRDGQGVTRDYEEALRWWRKAAEQGVVDAQYALGNIYAGGTGIARDNVLAYMWYSIATAHTGDEWLGAIAGTNRDVLAARMTPTDISKAQRLTADWLAKHGK
jgi:TPR repeat protein